MKIDIYTKTVLTIIAVSLSVIAIRSAIPNAYASEVQKVVICDQGGKNCSDVFGGALRIREAKY